MGKEPHILQDQNLQIFLLIDNLQQFTTLETSGSLGRVWLRKGFWDCYRGHKSRSREKNIEETNVSKLGSEIRVTEDGIPGAKHR